MKARWPLLLVLFGVGGYALLTRPQPAVVPHYSPAQLETLMQGVFVSARPAIVQLQTLSIESTRTASGQQHRLISEGRATGFFISADGFVLTAHHAIAGKTQVHVLTTRQERLPARVVGFDESHDLALLKAVTLKPEPYLNLELQRTLGAAEPLVEVGNSGTDFIQPRYGAFKDFRTDDGLLVPTRLARSSIPLNPGDSGGAVLDFHGKAVAIGIGFMKSDEGNLSLLVPFDGLASTLAQLRAGAKLHLPGVGLHVIHNEPSGVLIDHVEPGSSAETAGINAGVVTALDDQVIVGQSDYYSALRKKHFGDHIKVTVQTTNALRDYTLELR